MSIVEALQGGTVSVPEAAKLTGWPKSTIYAMIVDGRLRHINQGRTPTGRLRGIRIPKLWLDQDLQKHNSGGSDNGQTPIKG